MSHHYHDQPRVPKGRDDGGQWTRDPHGPHELLQPTLYRRPAPSKGAIVKWIINGAIDGALALFTWRSLGNRPGRRAVIEFRAREFRSTKTGVLDLKEVKTLNEDEVKTICRKLGTVQELTDKAFEKFGPKRDELSPQDFGSKVHAHVAEQINGPRGPDDPKEPDFRAEVSALKTHDEVRTTEEPKSKKGKHDLKTVPYGTKDSIRVDVFENLRNGTVCVYDIKTGGKPLDGPRMAEIAGTIFKRYGGAERIIVTEVRPRVAPPRR